MTGTRVTSLAASTVILLAVALEAPAQIPGSMAPGTAPMQSGPTFSPYLNLLQRGGSPAINYYGLVRPEIQFRNTMQSLANELEQTQTEVAVGGQPPTLTQTGHPIQFFNLGHYYPGSVQGGQGHAGVGGATGATGNQGGMGNVGGFQNFTNQALGATGAAASTSRGTGMPSAPGR